jgi:hypothetical protein
VAPAAVFAASAVAAFAAARASGSYEISWWAPEAALLALCCYVAWAGGRRPARPVAAAAALFLALGAWGLLSIAWGARPDDAWRFADRSALAAAALVAGGLLGPAARRAAVAGVAFAWTALAVELVVRVGLGVAPADWFYGRTIDGPVGYHNAQGTVFAAGLALVLPGLASLRRSDRAAAAASVSILAAALLLTQSRGALAAALVACAAVALVRRDARLTARLLPLPGALGVLFLALRHVDRDLAATPGSVGAAGTTYLAVAAAVAGAYAAVTALPLSRAWARRASLGAALAAAALAGWAHQPLASAAGSARAQLATDTAPQSAAGTTRFASVTLNGRRDLWRVGLHMWAAHPVAGNGEGSFAREWTVSRRTQLYVLQPHSIEIELGSELGAVGLALFAAALVLLLRTLRPLRRAPALAAVAALTALVVESSVDWTWSFPGLVAPVLLVAGAAAPRRAAPASSPSRVRVAAAGVLTAAAVGAVGLPFGADREATAAAAALDRHDPAAALASLARARAFDRWNPDAALLRGLAASELGHPRAAAAAYGRAARLSSRPWVGLYERARVERAAGLPAASRDCAAALAENPLEPALREGVCASGSRPKTGATLAKAARAAAARPRIVQPGW